MLQYNPHYLLNVWTVVKRVVSACLFNILFVLRAHTVYVFTQRIAYNSSSSRNYFYSVGFPNLVKVSFKRQLQSCYNWNISVYGGI